MDKFGIFNILNSFFNKKEQTNEQASPSPTKTNGEQTDFLSSLLNSLSAKPQPQQTTPKPQQKITPPPQIPLQSQMLNTMRSHDDFIKRVQENQQKL